MYFEWDYYRYRNKEEEECGNVWKIIFDQSQNLALVPHAYRQGRIQTLHIGVAKI